MRFHGRHAFEEDENKILQRNIEENSNNIVKNHEQVAVSSIASVGKTSTSSPACSWLLYGIVIWKEKEALYKTSRK